MVDHQATHHPDRPVHHHVRPAWLDRYLHSGLAWAITSMFVLLAFMLTGIRAATTGATADYQAFFIVAVLAIVFAVFVVPAWALAFLERGDEDGPS